MHYPRLIHTLVFLFCLATSLACTAGTGSGAGFRLLELNDPVGRKQMKAAVFYPAQESGGTTKMGPLEIAAAKDAPIQAGRHPLVLFSHGNGAGMFSHHDIASELAKQGFIVAAIEHPGDNFRDDSGLGTDRVLIGRNLQLTALLDFLLGHPALAPSIDPVRVGAAGFSAGGYTALLMVGAQPKFDLLKAYCARAPGSALCVGGGTVRISSPPLLAKPDARIRAAFVMNPVLAFFDQDGLSRISVPVHVYSAANDSVLPAQGNTFRVDQALRTLTKHVEVPGAEHFVFLSPCTPPMKSAAPALCADPPGIDRQAVHDTLNRDAAAFFRTHLTGL